MKIERIPKTENQDKKKPHVQPKHEEHAFNLPFWRDNEKLWKLEVPVEDMPIGELLWILDVPFWENENGDIVITPREVMDEMDKFPEHRDRILNADDSYPIDIMKNRKGNWLTLDGLHRLVKIVMEGKNTVKVRKVPPEMVHLAAKDE